MTLMTSKFKIQNNETRIYYAGKNVQNEIVSLLAKEVQERIIHDAHEAKYFAIILDCTPVISHVEQMTIRIRFVSCSDKKRSKACVR